MSELSTTLIKELVKSTYDKTETEAPRFYGTAQVQDDGIYVVMDGSGETTPVSAVTDAQTGDRVLVEIVDHAARIIQNLDKSNSDIVGDRIANDEFGIFKELRVGKEYVDTLIAKDITADSIVADSAKIDDLEATNATITGTLEAQQASIEDLIANKINVKDLEAKFANIDFSNIGEAAVEKLFAESGIIKDIVVSEGKITGELVGVTIKGDLIEANTLKADKLVVLGENGLYYKLNVNALGETTASSDPKYQTGLDGSVIVAESITAEKIAVTDLIAFGATIGGFKIGINSLYSDVKSSIDNSTRGIYMDTDGQVYFGDATNFIKYYKDQNGDYQLEITANTVKFGTSGTSIEEVTGDIAAAAKTATNFLSYDSTNGLLLGNKISGAWSGYRSQMLPTAFNILDASGNVMSSYGAVTTIGKTGDQHIYIDSDSLDIKNGSSVLASFGAVTTIGKTGDQHIYIDSDSLDIKNGSSVLASFGAYKLELGKNSEQSIIEMCGGLASLSSEVKVDENGNKMGYILLSPTEHAQSKDYPFQCGIASGKRNATVYLGDGECSIGTHLTPRAASINYIQSDVSGLSEFDPDGPYAYTAIGMYAGMGLTDGREPGAGVDMDAYLNNGVVESSLSMFADTITINGYPLADYVIERGTSGIWRYEKWHSGKAVAYMPEFHTYSNLKMTASGNLYISDNHYMNLPNGLFVDTNYIVSHEFQSEGGPVTILRQSNSKNNQFLFKIYKVFKTNTGIKVKFSVKGRWR